MVEASSSCLSIILFLFYFAVNGKYDSTLSLSLTYFENNYNNASYHYRKYYYCTFVNKKLCFHLPNS